jgi:hypothetical protein
MTPHSISPQEADSFRNNVVVVAELFVSRILIGRQQRSTLFTLCGSRTPRETSSRISLPQSSRKIFTRYYQRLQVRCVPVAERHAIVNQIEDGKALQFSLPCLVQRAFPHFQIHRCLYRVYFCAERQFSPTRAHPHLPHLHHQLRQNLPLPRRPRQVF